MIFRRFLNTFQRFSKIVLKARQMFPNISRRKPNISEEEPMFRSYSNTSEYMYLLRDYVAIAMVIFRLVKTRVKITCYFHG